MDLQPTFALATWVSANKDFLGLTAAGIGGALALWRYYVDEKWKKSQFAFSYAEESLADPACRMALDFIDWSVGSTIIPEVLRDNVRRKTISWTVDEVATALRVHDQGDDDFSWKESVMRTAFDALLERFERLGYFIDKNTLSISDFPATMAYYVSVLKEDRAKPIREALNAYTDRYKFHSARKLLGRMGLPEFASRSAN